MKKDGIPIFAVCYIAIAYSFLCGYGVQVYDRDGNQLAHFVKGDPYLKVGEHSTDHTFTCYLLILHFAVYVFCVAEDRKRE